MRVRSRSQLTPTPPVRASRPRAVMRAVAPLAVGGLVLAGCSGGEETVPASEPAPAVGSDEPDAADSPTEDAGNTEDTQDTGGTGDTPESGGTTDAATDAPATPEDTGTSTDAPSAEGSAPVDLTAAALTASDFPLAGYERESGDAEDVWGDSDDGEATVFGDPVSDISAQCTTALDTMDSLGNAESGVVTAGFDVEEDDAAPEFALTLSQDPEDAAAVLLTLPEVCGQVTFSDDDSESTDYTFTPFPGDAEGIAVTEQKGSRTVEYTMVTESVGDVRVVVLSHRAAPEESVQVLQAQAEKVRGLASG